jgi:PBP1b-binding outer membrane lipoprotein LpoB
MRPISLALAAVLLAGCGAETAGTAATAGAARKQEVDQAKKTLDQAKRGIDDAMAKSQQRLQESDAASK